MTKHFSLFVFLFTICFSGFSQTSIDEFVSIDFPYEVTKETREDSEDIITELYAYSEDSTAIFELQRIFMLTDYEKPLDISELRDYYAEFLLGYHEDLASLELEVIDNSEYMIKDFLAQKVQYRSTYTGELCSETRIFVLENAFYIASYYNDYDYDESIKNEFMNSIRIETSNSPVQIEPNAKNDIASIMGQVFLYLIGAGLIAFTIVKYIKSRNRSTGSPMDF